MKRFPSREVLRVPSKDRTEYPAFHGLPLVSAQEPAPFDKETFKRLREYAFNGSHLIVSMFAAGPLMAAFPKYPGRILCPDTSPASAVRDEKGRIVGVRRLEWMNPP